MTPDQLAKSDTEAAHQTALFAWAAVAMNHGFNIANAWADGLNPAVQERKELAIPELKWLHHIPNGGSRGNDVRSQQIRGAQLKAQGVKSGVSDVFLPVKRGQFSGLYIEMKRPAEKPKREGSKGGVSDEQKEFGAFVQTQGFGFVVCYSWAEAAKVLEQYMEQQA